MSVAKLGFRRAARKRLRWCYHHMAIITYHRGMSSVTCQCGSAAPLPNLDLYLKDGNEDGARKLFREKMPPRLL